PSLDMYDPANGWRRWPEPCTYDRDWLARFRAAQRDRVARIDGVATESLAQRDRERRRAKDLEPGTPEWIRATRKGSFGRYLTIYRTLANPAYLDLSIDPDDRPMGSVFAFPDPLL